jgi:hypothetical protein
VNLLVHGLIIFRDVYRLLDPPDNVSFKTKEVGTSLLCFVVNLVVDRIEVFDEVFWSIEAVVNFSQS